MASEKSQPTRFVLLAVVLLERIARVELLHIADRERRDPRSPAMLHPELEAVAPLIEDALGVMPRDIEPEMAEAFSARLAQLAGGAEATARMYDKLVAMGGSRRAIGLAMQSALMDVIATTNLLRAELVEASGEDDRAETAGSRRVRRHRERRRRGARPVQIDVDLGDLHLLRAFGFLPLETEDPAAVARAVEAFLHSALMTRVDVTSAWQERIIRQRGRLEGLAGHLNHTKPT